MLTSPRRSISYPNPDRSDRPDIPAHIKNLVDAIELDMIYVQGTDAARLARPHLVGVFYYATDTGIFWYDDGSTWRQVGPPTPVVPTGTILSFAAATPPSGFLVCDGSAQSRTTYAALFALIGTTYGAGDGGTTFNIPDMQGRIAVGKGSNAKVNALGLNDGLTNANRRPSVVVVSYGGGTGGSNAGVAGTYDVQGFMTINYIIKT